MAGGLQDGIEAAFILDVSGDIEGAIVIGGILYETQGIPQLQPVTGEQVFLSGDGTGKLLTTVKRAPISPDEHSLETARSVTQLVVQSLMLSLGHLVVLSSTSVGRSVGWSI